MDVQLLTSDFGRVAKIFITKCVAGQYYYAQQAPDDSITWVRQVHEEEVKPFFTCPKEMAKIIAKAIDLVP